MIILHGQGRVGLRTSTHATTVALNFIWCKASRLQRLLLLMLSLQLLLEILQSRSMEVAVCELASLKSATAEATTVIVEAATNDLPTSDYNTPCIKSALLTSTPLVILRRQICARSMSKKRFGAIVLLTMAVVEGREICLLDALCISVSPDVW